MSTGDDDARVRGGRREALGQETTTSIVALRRDDVALPRLRHFVQAPRTVMCFRWYIVSISIARVRRMLEAAR